VRDLLYSQAGVICAIWLEQRAMRADGIEVLAADRSEWEEAAAAFRLSLHAAAPPTSQAAPVAEATVPAEPVDPGNPIAGHRVLVALTGLFRNRLR
jgi:hypothetical protein